MRRILTAVACVAVAIILCGIWSIRNHDLAGARVDSDASRGDQEASENSNTTADRRLHGAGAGRIHPADVLDETRAALRRASTAEAARESLSAARSRLMAGGPDAAAAVAAELRAGIDMPTRLSFAVGADGVLAGAPTWRTALLDWLPSLDPDLALELAREVLHDTQSADEYALALRNLAWNDLGGDLRAELSSAFLGMIERREWREHPSAGFLEAMDVAVQLGGVDVFARLSALATPDANDETLVRAAAMAMDRMILRDPALLAAAWRGIPAWMDGAPLQRASMMSRLDITNGKQRALFEAYLSSLRMTAEEADYFARIHPNGNRLHGHRLVSSAEDALSISRQQEFDRRTIAVLNDMIPGLPAVAAATANRIRERLSGFMEK